MHKLFRAALFVAAVALAATACGGAGSIEVEDARFRLSRSDLGAGYMTVTNTTNEAVTLESVSAAGVGSIGLHESMPDDNGAMTMQARPNGFEIAAGEIVFLEPGGKHLMIFDPDNTEDLTLTLDFGDQSIEVIAAYDEEASAAALISDDDEHADHGDDEHADHGDDEHGEHGDDEHGEHGDDEHGDDEHGEHGDDEHGDHGDDEHGDHGDDEHGDHGDDEHNDDAMEDMEDAMEDVEDAMEDMEDAMEDVEDAMEDAEDAMQDAEEAAN